MSTPPKLGLPAGLLGVLVAIFGLFIICMQHKNMQCWQCPGFPQFSCFVGLFFLPEINQDRKSFF